MHDRKDDVAARLHRLDQKFLRLDSLLAVAQLTVEMLMAEKQGTSDEVAGLRELIEQDSMRDQDALVHLMQANKGLREKVEKLEANGVVPAGEFAAILDGLETTRNYLTPFSPVGRPGKTIEVESDVDSMSVNQASPRATSHGTSEGGTSGSNG